jgi:hypothetical protein
MTDLIPIREGVLPEMDVEREMVDYLQKEMRRFKDDASQPATRIALVISGKGGDGKFYSRTNTWDSRESSTTCEHSAYASAQLMKRAIDAS